MHELIIRRSEWLEPHLVEPNESFVSLLKFEDRYCCLGIYAKACGFKDEYLHMCTPGGLLHVMRGRNLYDKLNDDQKEYFSRLVNDSVDAFVNASVTRKMIQINDDFTLSLSEKELKLTELFAEIGIKLSFVD